MSAFTESEDARRERRLWREAQTNNLGTLIHSGVTDRSKAQLVRCEVTYQEEGDVEHCGWWNVYVPEIDPEGMPDEEALAAHPASLATDKLIEWVDENRQYVYFSIDDTYPA